MRPLLIAALLLASTSAFADQAPANQTPARSPAGLGLGISPVINDLLPGQKVATVTVANHTGCAAPFQFSVTKWTQINGVDVDTPTDAVRAVPAIATIPDGQNQVVRIARVAPANNGAEEQYRLDVLQVAKCPTKPGAGPSAQIVYHFMAPIFYRGPSFKSDLKAVWSDGKLVLRNDGTATADVFGAAVNGAPWKVHALHVLPGSTIAVTPLKGPATQPASIDVKVSPKASITLSVE
ncbi:MAG: molecular chaperone [Rhodanobacter sp.]|nr:MAG: molecular chaperone [Rhodanobacter sp.]TAM40129.1 MAG: molecular chaperone [Rhodanobacter sp.]